MYINQNDFWLFDGCDAVLDMDTARLFDAITLVSREIDEYCNTSFEPVQDDFTLEFCRGFFTRRRPLLDISELLLDGVPLAEGIGFFVSPERSYIKMLAPFEEYTAGTADYKTIQVRYSYGYRTVPATVTQTAAELIKLDTETMGTPVLGLQSESWDNEYSYTRRSSKDFTPSQMRRAILARLDEFKVPAHSPSADMGMVRARLL